ncbi:MAG: TVP38/TMEM64 family protein [Patescibacteria group bacterium]
MTSAHRLRLLKGALLVLWLSVVAGAFWLLFASGIPAHDLPRLVRNELREGDVSGPFLVIGAFLASLGVPFPTMSLALVAGSAYGPLWGGLLAIIGFNLCTTFGFWLGRLFGRHFVEKHERGWVKKYDQRLCRQGLVTVLFMRLFYFPSDVVSIGCGMTEMPFRQYVIGTFFGSLPLIITFTVLGDAFRNPRAWILFSVLFVLCVAIALSLRYSAWGKRTLVPPVCPTAVLPEHHDQEPRL